MLVRYLEPTVALIGGDAFDVDALLRMHAALIDPDDPPTLAPGEVAYLSRHVEAALRRRDRALAEHHFRTDSARALFFLEDVRANLPAAVCRRNTLRRPLDDRLSMTAVGSIRQVLHFVPAHDGGIYIACEGREGAGAVTIAVGRIDAPASDRQTFRFDERVTASVLFSVWASALA